ncbi:MAG: GNAT family N-acetyltransferase [Shewanella sp.]
MQIRLFSPNDVTELAAVFNASVMEGTQEYYSLTERLAWAQHRGEPRSDAYWLDKLADTTTWVAEEDHQLVGFINLKPQSQQTPPASLGTESQGAQIDCLFVHPDYSRAGVATLLYLALLEEAKARGLKRLTVEASYQARPFFEKQGFNCLRRNEHRRYLTAADEQQNKPQVLVNFSLLLSLS